MIQKGVIKKVGFNNRADIQLIGSTAVISNVLASAQIDWSTIEPGKYVLVQFIDEQPIILHTLDTQTVRASQASYTTTVYESTATLPSNVLLDDGSVPLIGNLPVSPGITIDGCDISVLCDLFYDLQTQLGGGFFVGKEEGPHAGLFRLLDNTVQLRVVDTANVPILLAGAVDYRTNTTFLNIGYAGKPGIRLPLGDQTPGAREQIRGMEIDAETLVGVVPSDILPFTGTPDGTKFLRDDLSWQAAVNKTVRIVTATTTELTTDNLIVCDKSSAMTVNLLAATGSGRKIIIKSIGAGAVTVDPLNAETIDGETTQTLGLNDSMTLVDYASGKWVII